MRPMKLQMLPFEADDLIRLQCEGPLSLAGLSQGADPLQQVLGPKAFGRKVLLDLKLAEGADTSGIAWLIRTTERFAQAGGRLVLVSVPPMVEQISLVLGLDSHLTSADSAAEAEKFALREAAAAPTAGPNGANGDPDRLRDGIAGPNRPA